MRQGVEDNYLHQGDLVFVDVCSFISQPDYTKTTEPIFAIIR